MSRGHGRVERHVLSYVDNARTKALGSTDAEIYEWRYGRPMPQLREAARVVQVLVARELTLLPTAAEIARELGLRTVGGYASTYESVRRSVHLLIRDGRLQQMRALFDPAPNLQVGGPKCASEVRSHRASAESVLGHPLGRGWSTTEPRR